MQPPISLIQFIRMKEIDLRQQADELFAEAERHPAASNVGRYIFNQADKLETKADTLKDLMDEFERMQA